jgi:N-acetylglucosaminyldiphosphoundecaprenol N-acetyl-beta-D-mannosaminyltransferase
MHATSQILSLNIHNISFPRSIVQITNWGMERRSGFVCFANVHMIVEAHKSSHFRDQISKASLVLPDGKPLAVACKWLHNRRQERISGMDFMPAMLKHLAKHDARIFLYGSTEDILDRLTEKISSEYPGIKIVGQLSPPFRQLTAEEKAVHIDQINKSQANFVFVALGCPKQEAWMAENYQHINSILLGVGGAFPVLAGVQKRSPRIMQYLSLEWLFRLMQEPKRLYKRYFFTNAYFIALLLRTLSRKTIGHV